MKPQRQIFGIAAGLLLFLAGCSIPKDTAASPITSVPYDLLETNSPTTAEPVEELETEFKLLPYWVLATDPSALTLSKRPTESAPSLQDAYDVLVQGPNEADRAENPDLTTFVPVSLGAVLPENPDADGILTITIDAESGFTENTATREPIGAQLVCTYLTFNLVKGVIMVDTNGTPVPMTGFGATTIEGPANATHFNNCEPPLAPEVETTETTLADG